ncbi:MAG: Synechococcus phage [Pseudomonadota bacterium]
MATASKSYSRSRASIDKLMWPANLTSVFDYLQIDIVEFVPIAQATSSTASNTTTPTAPVNASSITSGIVSIAGGLINGGLSNVQLSNPQADVKQTVLLPVPENLNYTDALKWEEADITAMGKLLPGIAAGVMGGNAGGATAAIQNAASAGKIGAILEAVKSMGFNANALTSGIGGKISNPYTEQVFGGISMRSFELSWKLVPRSQSEQKSIHEMIKEVRKYALPNYSGTLGGLGDAGDRIFGTK